MVFPRLLQFFSEEIAHRFSKVTVLGVLLNARDTCCVTTHLTSQKGWKLQFGHFNQILKLKNNCKKQFSCYKGITIANAE